VHVQDLALHHTWTWKWLNDGDDHPVTANYNEQVTEVLPQNATTHDFLLPKHDEIADLVKLTLETTYSDF